MNIPDWMIRIHRFKQQYENIQGLYFLIPILLGVILILALWLLYDTERFFQITGLIFLYFIPPAGKESIIPTAIAFGFPWQVVCFVFTYVDIVLCLFMLWNFDIICKIPFMGKWIHYLVQNGSVFLSKHLWVERFCFIGLSTFVFIPLQGSGSIGGVILGRILGMSTVQIFIAVLIGTFLQSYLIGLSMYAIQEYLNLNLWYLVILIIILVLVTSSISLAAYQLRKRWKW